MNLKNKLELKFSLKMQRFVVKISSWVHSVGKYKKQQFIIDIKRIKIFFIFFSKFISWPCKVNKKIEYNVNFNVLRNINAKYS